jgi:hypothetical protein
MNTGLRILILSDNKPGHITGSLGVLASIEKLTPVQAVTLQVRLRLKFMRYPLRLLMNRPGLLNRMPRKVQQGLIRLLYAIHEPRPPVTAGGFDWLISTGGDTSFLNVWLARLQGARNIFNGSLRGLSPACFTVAISRRPGQCAANVIRPQLPPVPVDRVKICAQGQAFRLAQKMENQKVWAVLIGGDGAGYRYGHDSMKQLAAGLLALARRNDTRLLVTTSRRTGLMLEQTLKTCFDAHPAVAYATYYNHQPEKVVAKFLGTADVVFCTEDSSAMITEVIAAGRPVYELAPEKVRPQPYHQAFLRQHVDARHIRQVSIQALPMLDVSRDVADYFRLLEYDPISELASKIKAWITPEASCT